MVTITSGVERWVADEARRDAKEEPKSRSSPAHIPQAHGFTEEQVSRRWSALTLRENRSKEEAGSQEWAALVRRENGAGKQVYLNYRPFAKQGEFHASPAKYRLFGGAAGPGKSKALLMEAVVQAHDHPGANTLLLRRTFPELEQSLLLYFRRDDSLKLL
jgi:hypothetical protein